MSSRSIAFLVHGTELPVVAPTLLRAGPLSLDYDNGDLRCVKLGEREILRRVYGAVRDRHWNTVAGILSDKRIEVSDSAFRITYTSTHQKGGVQFVWHAELCGDADGTLKFTFDGEAQTDFLRNRIGLCVLHPLRDCAGARVRVWSIDGAHQDLVFPEIIAAEQPIRGFTGLAGLVHEVAPGLEVEVRFTGEAFETEDQRNWIDASFKTYGTSLSLPFPVEVKAGTRIRQSVEVRLRAADRSRGAAADSQYMECRPRLLSPMTAVQVKIPTDGWLRLPELGLGCSSNRSLDYHPNSARFKALPLSHLRFDLWLADGEWGHHFLCALLESSTLGLSLELAVHLPSAGEAGVADLQACLGTYRSGTSHVRLKRILAFRDGEKSTTPATLAKVREFFGPLGVPIGAGTNADLYQLNLQRPPSDGDFISWSMNPQVHASDTRSLMESPEAASAQVASVKHYFPGIPLVVSPVTLKPRFNPTATGHAGTEPTDELPPAVDPRQMSLAGAAWLVGMLAALAPSGVESLTFFETTGWCGVMETASGSTLPEKFPSYAGRVFPLWHVFAALSGFDTVVAAKVSDPGRVAALAAGDPAGRRRLILANLTMSDVDLDLAGATGTVRVLEGANVSRAMRHPAQWWRRPAAPLADRLRLSAFAVAFVDVS